MCGIVGAIAQRDVAEILLEGLRRLEYRGYDSAGLAIYDSEQINRLRRVGKVEQLAKALVQSPLSGGLGIAHTRWATHGEVNEINAHPHASGEDIAIVHNGVIENHETFRSQLLEAGYQFVSGTDTEVIAHLIHREMQNHKDLLQAVQKVSKLLIGTYGMVVIDRRQPDKMVATRSGSPIVIGKGIGEFFVASDQLALLPVTRQFVYLEEGEVVELSRDSMSLYDSDGKAVYRQFIESQADAELTDKGPYRHFMLKEIYQQPQALAETLEGRLENERVLIDGFGVKAAQVFSQVGQVHIVACGTSYHAGLVAKTWLEEIAGIPCQVEVASEYRYRKVVVPENCLFVCISQSGETADTLAALRQAKETGYLSTLSICNVATSSMVRESDLVFLTRAGVEIGVASTKAFTTQLVGLMLLTICLGRNKSMSSEMESELVKGLKHLPSQVEKSLQLNQPIKQLSEDFAEKHHCLFLGRGCHYPIAMEGALKLKEISYIHAEAYAAGELKHGPLALIDHDMPVVVVAPKNTLFDKLKSNMEVVRSRGGMLYVFADSSLSMQNEKGVKVISVDSVNEALSPIVHTIPLQLLSYHVAVLKGTDVDQPRNLAKSVTVE